MESDRIPGLSFIIRSEPDEPSKGNGNRYECVVCSYETNEGEQSEVTFLDSQIVKHARSRSHIVNLMRFQNNSRSFKIDLDSSTDTLLENVLKWEARMGSQEAIEPSVKYTPVEDTQVEDTPAGDNLEEDSDSLVPSLTSCNSHVSMLLSVEDSEEKLEELELSAGDSRRSIVRSLTSRNSHISKDDKENGAMKPKLDEESTSLLTTSIGESNSQCFKKNLELELSIPEINHNIVCNQDKDMSVRASIRDEPHRLSQQILNSSTNCTKMEYMENSFHEIQPICQDSMKKIELLQRLRIQRNIVIVTDEREYLNPDWISFGDDVKVLRIPSMKLGSVFPIIAMNPYFGKNTIWVFSGGINDILEQFPLRDCSEYSCSNPQTMLRLSRTMGDTSYLIKLSMQLNLNILHNTSNDIALFIGLIPVCINQYNQFTLRNRSCFSIHPAIPFTNIYLHFVHYNEYSKTVNLYNCFVEFHARSLGYSPWSLEKTENGENISLINLLQIDGYSIPWVKENNIRVSLLCDELLLMSSLTYEKRKRSIILQGLHWKLKYECLRKFFEEFGEVEMIGSSIANHGLFILFRSESTVVNVLKKDSTFIIEGITLSAKGFINDLFTFSKFPAPLPSNCGVSQQNRTLNPRVKESCTQLAQSSQNSNSQSLKEKPKVLELSIPDSNHSNASNPSSTNGGVSNLLAKESQKNQSLKQGVKESSTQLALSMQNLNLESSKEIPDALDISIPDINQINKWEARLGSQEAIEPSVKYTPVEDTQVEDTPAEDNLEEDSDSLVCNQDKDMSVRASIRDEPHRLSQQILNSSTNCTKMEYMENSFHEIQLICQDSMKKIELLQRLRIQRNIVIVTDEREYLNPDWLPFGDDVKVLRIPGMKLGSVFPIIAMNPYFGKNTIWVFSGGNNDILEQFPLRDCSEFSCPIPQTMLRLSRTMGDTSYLIKLSMQLNLNILLNTSNDIALFIGMIPVWINQYNQFKLRNRSCFLIHSARPIVTNTCLHFVYYNEYSKIVNLYNCFVEFHARSLGYSPWSLEKTENGENIPLFNLVQIDRYFIPWVKESYIRVSLLCRELLLMSSLTYEKRKRSIILQGLHWKLKNENLRKFFEEFGEVEMIGSNIAKHGLFILFRSESTVVNVLKKDSTFVIEGITLRAKGFINDLFTFSKFSAPLPSNCGVSKKNQPLNPRVKESSTQLVQSRQNSNSQSLKDTPKPSTPSSTKGGVSNLLAVESQKNPPLKPGEKECSKQFVQSLQNSNSQSSKETPKLLELSFPDSNHSNASTPSSTKGGVSNLLAIESQKNQPLKPGVKECSKQFAQSLQNSNSQSSKETPKLLELSFPDSNHSNGGVSNLLAIESQKNQPLKPGVKECSKQFAQSLQNSNSQSSKETPKVLELSLADSDCSNASTPSSTNGGVSNLLAVESLKNQPLKPGVKECSKQFVQSLQNSNSQSSKETPKLLKLSFPDSNHSNASIPSSTKGGVSNLLAVESQKNQPLNPEVKECSKQLAHSRPNLNSQCSKETPKLLELAIPDSNYNNASIPSSTKGGVSNLLAVESQKNQPLNPEVKESSKQLAHSRPNLNSQSSKETPKLLELAIPDSNYNNASIPSSSKGGVSNLLAKESQKNQPLNPEVKESSKQLAHSRPNSNSQSSKETPKLLELAIPDSNYNNASTSSSTKGGLSNLLAIESQKNQPLKPGVKECSKQFAQSLQNSNSQSSKETPKVLELSLPDSDCSNASTPSSTKGGVSNLLAIESQKNQPLKPGLKECSKQFAQSLQNSNSQSSKETPKLLELSLPDSDCSNASTPSSTNGGVSNLLAVESQKSQPLKPGEKECSKQFVQSLQNSNSQSSKETPKLLELSLPDSNHSNASTPSSSKGGVSNLLAMESQKNQSLNPEVKESSKQLPHSRPNLNSESSKETPKLLELAIPDSNYNNASIPSSSKGGVSNRLAKESQKNQPLNPEVKESSKQLAHSRPNLNSQSSKETPKLLGLAIPDSNYNNASIPSSSKGGVSNLLAKESQKNQPLNPEVKESSKQLAHSRPNLNSQSSKETPKLLELAIPDSNYNNASTPSSTKGGVSNHLAIESQKNQPLKPGVKESSKQFAQSLQNPNYQSSKEKPDALDISITDFNQSNVKNSILDEISKKTLKFDRVTIIADNRYKQFLNDFTNPQVSVLADQQITIENLEQHILKNKDKLTMSTLLLIVIGIHSFSRIVPLALCSRIFCDKPIQSLEPKIGIDNWDNFFADYVQRLNTVLNKVKSYLPHQSSIVLLPPLPISLINPYNNHKKLHHFALKLPDYWITNKLQEMQEIYPKWMDEIMNLAFTSMTEATLKYRYDFNKLHKLKKLDLMECPPNEKPTFTLWKEIALEIIKAALCSSLFGLPISLKSFHDATSMYLMNSDNPTEKKENCNSTSKIKLTKPIIKSAETKKNICMPKLPEINVKNPILRTAEIKKNICKPKLPEVNVKNPILRTAEIKKNNCKPKLPEINVKNPILRTAEIIKNNCMPKLPEINVKNPILRTAEITKNNCRPKLPEINVNNPILRTAEIKKHIFKPKLPEINVINPILRTAEIKRRRLNKKNRKHEVIHEAKTINRRYNLISVDMNRDGSDKSLKPSVNFNELDITRRSSGIIYNSIENNGDPKHKEMSYYKSNSISRSVNTKNKSVSFDERLGQRDRNKKESKVKKKLLRIKIKEHESQQHKDYEGLLNRFTIDYIRLKLKKKDDLTLNIRDKSTDDASSSKNNDKKTDNLKYKWEGIDEPSSSSISVPVSLSDLRLTSTKNNKKLVSFDALLNQQLRDQRSAKDDIRSDIFKNEKDNNFKACARDFRNPKRRNKLLRPKKILNYSSKHRQEISTKNINHSVSNLNNDDYTNDSRVFSEENLNKITSSLLQNYKSMKLETSNCQKVKNFENSKSSSTSLREDKVKNKDNNVSWLALSECSISADSSSTKYPQSKIGNADGHTDMVDIRSEDQGEQTNGVIESVSPKCKNFKTAIQKFPNILISQKKKKVPKKNKREKKESSKRKKLSEILDDPEPISIKTKTDDSSRNERSSKKIKTDDSSCNERSSKKIKTDDSSRNERSSKKIKTDDSSRNERSSKKIKTDIVASEIVSECSPKATRISEMVKLQSSRTQNNIVIVTDERDELDVNIAEFVAGVKVLKIPGMRFGSVFQLITENPNFGGGTIWILSGGIHDILHSNFLQCCLDFGCPTPQTKLSFPQFKVDLVEECLKLSFKILNSTQNDIALFSGMIPALVNQYNDYAMSHRSCRLVHPAKLYIFRLDAQTTYLNTVKDFNEFVKYQASMLGYSPWNLEVSEFNKQNLIKTLHLNGYNIHVDEQIKKAERVKFLCHELLVTSSLNLEERRRSILLRGLPRTIKQKRLQSYFEEFGQVERTGIRFSNIMDEHQIGFGYILFACESMATSVFMKGSNFFTFDGVTLQLSRVVKNQPPDAIDSKNCFDQDKSSIAPEKIFNYNKVVIIADSRYLPFLNQFKNSKVHILTDQQKKINNLEEYLSRKKKHLTTKTLYLLVIGIHSVSRMVSLNSCHMMGCSRPLESLELKIDLDQIDTFFIDYIKTINCTLTNVKSILPNDSNIAILPPLPISLINSNLEHDLLHTQKFLCPDYFVANKFLDLHHFYSNWMNTIFNFALSSMAKISLKWPYELCELRQLKNLVIMKCSVEDKPTLSIWKNMIASIVIVALSSSKSSQINHSVNNKVHETKQPYQTQDGKCHPNSNLENPSFNCLLNELSVPSKVVPPEIRNSDYKAETIKLAEKNIKSSLQEISSCAHFSENFCDKNSVKSFKYSSSQKRIETSCISSEVQEVIDDFNLNCALDGNSTKLIEDNNDIIELDSIVEGAFIHKLPQQSQTNSCVQYLNKEKGERQIIDLTSEDSLIEVEDTDQNNENDKNEPSIKLESDHNILFEDNLEALDDSVQKTLQLRKRKCVGDLNINKGISLLDTIEPNEDFSSFGISKKDKFIGMNLNELKSIKCKIESLLKDHNLEINSRVIGGVEEAKIDDDKAVGKCSIKNEKNIDTLNENYIGQNETSQFQGLVKKEKFIGINLYNSSQDQLSVKCENEKDVDDHNLEINAILLDKHLPQSLLKIQEVKLNDDLNLEKLKNVERYGIKKEKNVNILNENYHGQNTTSHIQGFIKREKFIGTNLINSSKDQLSIKCEKENDVEDHNFDKSLIDVESTESDSDCILLPPIKLEEIEVSDDLVILNCNLGEDQGNHNKSITKSTDNLFDLTLMNSDIDHSNLNEYDTLGDGSNLKSSNSLSVEKYVQDHIFNKSLIDLESTESDSDCILLPPIKLEEVEVSDDLLLLNCNLGEDQGTNLQYLTENHNKSNTKSTDNLFDLTLMNTVIDQSILNEYDTLGDGSNLKSSNSLSVEKNVQDRIFNKSLIDLESTESDSDCILLPPIKLEEVEVSDDLLLLNCNLGEDQGTNLQYLTENHNKSNTKSTDNLFDLTLMNSVIDQSIVNEYDTLGDGSNLKSSNSLSVEKNVQDHIFNKSLIDLESTETSNGLKKLKEMHRIVTENDTLNDVQNSWHSNSLSEEKNVKYKSLNNTNCSLNCRSQSIKGTLISRSNSLVREITSSMSFEENTNLKSNSKKRSSSPSIERKKKLISPSSIEHPESGSLEKKAESRSISSGGSERSRSLSLDIDIEFKVISKYKNDGNETLYMKGTFASLVGSERSRSPSFKKSKNSRSNSFSSNVSYRSPSSGRYVDYSSSSSGSNGRSRSRDLKRNIKSRPNSITGYGRSSSRSLDKDTNSIPILCGSIERSRSMYLKGNKKSRNSYFMRRKSEKSRSSSYSSNDSGSRSSGRKIDYSSSSSGSSERSRSKYLKGNTKSGTNYSGSSERARSRLSKGVTKSRANDCIKRKRSRSQSQGSKKKLKSKINSINKYTRSEFIGRNPLLSLIRNNDNLPEVHQSKLNSQFLVNNLVSKSNLNVGCKINNKRLRSPTPERSCMLNSKSINKTVCSQSLSSANKSRERVKSGSLQYNHEASSYSISRTSQTQNENRDSKLKIDASFETSKPKIDASFETSKPKIDASFKISKPKIDASFKTSKPKIDASFETSKPKIDASFETSKPKIDASFETSKPKIDASFETSKPKIDASFKISKSKIDASFKTSKPKIDASFETSKPKSHEYTKRRCPRPVHCKISESQTSRENINSTSKENIHSNKTSTKYKRKSLKPVIVNDEVRTGDREKVTLIKCDFKSKSVNQENVSKPHITNFFSKSTFEIQSTHDTSNFSTCEIDSSKFEDFNSREAYQFDKCKDIIARSKSSKIPYTLEKPIRFTPKSVIQIIPSKQLVLEFLDEEAEQCTEVSSSSEDFNPFVYEDALSLIEILCDKLVFLGPAIKKMIAVAKDLGTTTKEAYIVFTIPENVALVNLMLSKFETLSKSCSDDTHLFKKAVIIIPKFLEEAKNGSVPRIRSKKR